MAKNHYICRAYLRGFSSQDGKLEELSSNGIVTLSNVIPDDVCFEEADVEPHIEDLRARLENWWGKYRKNIQPTFLRPANRGQRENIAEFVAKTILLSRIGREIVKRDRLDIKRVTQSDSILISEAAADLKMRFLKLKWQLINPGLTLMCGEIPSVWTYFKIDNEEECSQHIRGILFPLDQCNLLYMNLKDEGLCASSDPKEEVATMAVKYGIDYNIETVRIARANNSKLYAPVGFREQSLSDLYFKRLPALASGPNG